MKKVFSFFLAAAFVFTLSCKSTQIGGTADLNQLTKKEKEEGWVLLFDGKTSEGWKGYNKDHFPACWDIVDGSLHCNEVAQGANGNTDRGDIVTTKEYSNFTLKLDWKIAPGGNSGIFYLGKEDPKWGAVYFTAPEVQVLDNERHPDAKMGKDGNRMAGSLYDLIPAVPQNANPAGEWNTVEIVIKDGNVVHRQNGKTVVEFELWTDEWKELVSGSKFPGLNPDWANVPKSGVIALQDHGNDVWFRNIKILEH